MPPCFTEPCFDKEKAAVRAHIFQTFPFKSALSYHQFKCTGIYKEQWLTKHNQCFWPHGAVCHNYCIVHSEEQDVISDLQFYLKDNEHQHSWLPKIIKSTQAKLCTHIYIKHFQHGYSACSGNAHVNWVSNCDTSSRFQWKVPHRKAFKKLFCN